MGSIPIPHYDVLIVGAGFSGVYMLYQLRKMGMNCKVYEAEAALGGIWYWNAYPGIRVDSEVPVYEYSEPEVWKDWTWTEKYPAGEEILKYFDHVDKVWDIKRDVEFNMRVIGAQFDMTEKVWKIETDDGRTTTCQFFIPATGFAAKRYVPPFKGIETFKGKVYHSSCWPHEGVQTKGKRVGIIGTGATGVQIAQECAKDAASLLVFQRTPNLALPMRQGKLTPEEQESRKPTYPEFYRNRLQTFGGMRYTFLEKHTADATPKEREAFFEQLWTNGGFQFWLGGPARESRTPGNEIFLRRWNPSIRLGQRDHH
ncbi:cyclopentanone 1,2-monooxygenase [Coccidioides immitis H538.4]|uniref:Cyclopentanone 1,2-monooxygenase n=1 Tax=Coccidioides immitis H538.4 TaxID=396776 RepID=A0A0J8RQL3_COCIT|nr:cyclopentanone 1,2-monooxygenase [Coccidioides immitis H538.4]